MSIQGVGGPGGIPVLPREPGASPEQERVSEKPSSGAMEAPPASLGLAALAPPGADPALWSVLTADERAYFERVQALGPITYGPNSSPAAPAARVGGRIDLKV
ncbi:MAG: hypothetical protein HKN73_03050 [Gemmatimonadetes bacterium]|nr:hypothetical protein [Gemmatimonadota bacterium]